MTNTPSKLLLRAALKNKYQIINFLLTFAVLVIQTSILYKQTSYSKDQTSYTKEQANASRNDDRQKVYEQLRRLGPLTEKARAYGEVFEKISANAYCGGACSNESISKASIGLEGEKFSDLEAENYQDRSLVYRGKDDAAEQLFNLHNIFRVVMPRYYDPSASPLPVPLDDLKRVIEDAEIFCNFDIDEIKLFSRTIPYLSPWLARVPVGTVDNLTTLTLDSTSRYFSQLSMRNNTNQRTGLPIIASSPDLTSITVQELYSSIEKQTSTLWPILNGIAEKCDQQYFVDRNEYRRLSQKLE